MKKTIEVKTLKDRVNKYLSLDSISQVEKSAMAHILETILHDTDNYKGFSYSFDWNSLPHAEAKAIEFNRQYL